jgi:sigma-B regulation protein RsbU (phosphoserine phosphatase)
VEYLETVKRVTAEKERIGTELTLATQIQSAMLPHIVPAFPDRTDFDIIGSMDPAKEVGGDFFDYYLVDPDHLCMVMADVSGKGVPAALFMMACKIILQSMAMLGQSPAEILKKTNEAICPSNEAEMFVTVWIGMLELSTGKLTCANAGHEYPVFKRPGGRFELYKDKHGIVVGGMEGVKYKDYEVQLYPGSKIFVYTDGVPEATNSETVLYGVERMTEAINKLTEKNPEGVLVGMREAVDDFVKEAEQFDDLTMLCLEYKGNVDA